MFFGAFSFFSFLSFVFFDFFQLLSFSVVSVNGFECFCVCVCVCFFFLLEWYWKPQTDRSGNELFRPVQTAERVVVKYLDRKARAPTANRRSHSGVGGARRGVREYGDVNYHKVELKEQAKRDSSVE